jgi:PAS domain S-box-containing protein
MASPELVPGVPGPVDLRLLTDSIPSLIHTARPDGYLDYFNRRWLEYLGCSLTQIEGWNWTDFIYPDDVDGIVNRWRASIASGQMFEYEARVRRADGQYRWMFHRKVPLRDVSGKILKWYGSSIDIDDRRRAEEALRRSEDEAARRIEKELRDVIDAMPAYAWSALPDGTVDFFNQRWEEYTGRPLEEGLGWDWQAAAHPDDLPGFLSQWQAALANGQAMEYEVRVLRADGQYRWWLVRNVPMHNHRSEIVRWYGAAFDIHDKKDVEGALKATQAYLAEAQRLTHTGSWAWNVADRSGAHFSEEWYRIFGFDPAAGVPVWEKRLARVHPEDRVKWSVAIERAIVQKSDYELDFRIAMPDGMVKWIHAVGHPVLGASGHLLQFVGSSTDITDRKIAEEKIREQEIELRQILDMAPQLVAVFGPNWERLYINRMALEYLGVSLEEWQQQSKVEAEIHTDDAQRLQTSMDRALSSDFADELEVRIRRADGIYRWFLARFNPVRDDKGQIRRWYVACTDIEDRKRIEERLQHENVALREEIDKTSMFEEIVGASPALQAVLSRISKVAPSDSTVLITGETGTGKELVARAIHRRSNRASHAFVSVNCAAIPRDLIASELFGHEKGAFTGATQQRLGRFELASGGTLFLDEVGELPPETQIALLRVLQEREFERVGGTRLVHTDVRVIAATNRDLESAIGSGTFRSDLFYRLNVFPIEIPALREREEDILLLVEYFVHRYGRKAGKRIKGVSQKTLKLLQSYTWPGNIRELQNVIERSVILCDAEIFSIDENWLPQHPCLAGPHNHTEHRRRFLAQEKNMIEAALKESRGRIFGPTGAAANLGMPRSTLESKIRSLKIDKNRFKTSPGA